MIKEAEQAEKKLHHYRLIFILSQTILLGVEAIIVGQYNMSNVAFILAFLAIIQIWYIWFLLLRDLWYRIDYYNFGSQLESQTIDQLGGKEKYSLHVDRYVNNIDSYRKQVNARFTLEIQLFKSNWTLERVKIDVLIPMSFTILWITFILHT